LKDPGAIAAVLVSLGILLAAAAKANVFDRAVPYLKISMVVFAFIVLAAAFIASLYVMLAARFSEDAKKAAWGTVGTVVGFAIGVLVKL
jgi:hypothetical protein